MQKNVIFYHLRANQPLKNNISIVKKKQYRTIQFIYSKKHTYWTLTKLNWILTLYLYLIIFHANTNILSSQ